MATEAPLSAAHNLANEETAGLELLTVDEVAAMLNVSKSWVYEHTRISHRQTDCLPFVKLGKYLRFEKSALLAFLERQRFTAGRTGR
jgi:excisionase family DNA binding protein